MCLICVDVFKNKITPKEIARAWLEEEPSLEHQEELLTVLEKANILEAVIEESFNLEATK